MDAGIYARISLDRDEDTLGVQRQVQDCAAEAQRRGWDVVQTYVDNDVSATRSKVRPEYQRMLADIKAGTISGFIVWDIDRLTRTPRELEDIIDLADRHKIQLANIGGDIDLSSPQGRMTARIKGSVARHESEQQSRRLKRKFEQKAAAGEPHGIVPFGYKRERYTLPNGTESVRDVPHPEQAPLVKDAAKRVLAGESLRGIAAAWNSKGIKSPRGGVWVAASIKQMLKRPSNAGLRSLRGEIVGKSNADPLYDEGTHTRLLALFEDRSRTTGAIGNAPKYLLSAIAVCGLCGGKMRRLMGNHNARTGKTTQPAYACRECFKIRRKQSLVEAVVTGAVVGRLQRPDLLAELTSGDPEAVERSKQELATLEARLSLAADQFADGDITGEQLKRITERIRPQVQAAKRRVEAAMPRNGIMELAGANAAANWEAASIDVQRAMIDELMTVTILPTTPGKSEQHELIKIDWKH